MSYKIEVTADFEKDLKKIFKKHRSIKNDLAELITSLEANPQQGTPLGNNCYKTRLAIASKGKGKSGGARVITNIVVDDTTVYLLTIYDKTDKDTLTNKELEELLKSVLDWENHLIWMALWFTKCKVKPDSDLKMLNY